MSKLTMDPKTVLQLFNNKDADFLIPAYQRPYAWEENECQILWDDLFEFAFPQNNCDAFDSEKEEYFLGAIVTFKGTTNQLEVIDGQQRLTTLMLLLRAFYEKYGNMKDDKAVKTSRLIEQCLWKTDEFGDPDKDTLKIGSQVATDDDKEQFLTILKTGKADEKDTSNYAANYRFFQNKISAFLNDYPDWFSFFPIRIMKNCILLQIEADSQNMALRIFSTLNDRGKPLSDADIFKAELYKYYNSKGQTSTFTERWKALETMCGKIFSSAAGSPMDELFSRYMYYERAKQNIKSSTTESLRNFYEKDSYSLLKNDQTFENLIDLANFWNDVQNQSVDRFSDRILQRLFVLHYAPNSMWTYFVSVYYMTNRNKDGLLDDEAFYQFLNKTTAFIWCFALTHSGVHAFRVPLYPEMVNIVNGVPVTFQDFRFNAQQLKAAFENYSFTNNRPITKSMLTWWAFQDQSQELIALETKLEIEHIFAKNRYELDNVNMDPQNIELLGNKSLLEKRINIRASDYRFSDKKKYYFGFINSRKKKKEGTKIQELVSLANTYTDFVENDILQRNQLIIKSFIDYAGANGLLDGN